MNGRSMARGPGQPPPKVKLPADRSVVEYWDLIDNGLVPRVVHYRATFYVYCEWKDHPWGRDREHGAAFENDWAIESFVEAYSFRGSDEKVHEYPAHWQSEGRGGLDWLERRLMSGIFTNEQAARDKVQFILAQRVADTTRKLIELRAALKKA